MLRTTFDQSGQAPVAANRWLLNSTMSHLSGLGKGIIVKKRIKGEKSWPTYKEKAIDIRFL